MSGPNEPGLPGEVDLPDEGEDFELPEEDLEEEPETPDAAEESLEEPAEPPRRQTRRERQENNWRERAIRAEAERDTIRQYQPPQTRPPVDPQAGERQLQAEYERISMLPPEQQVREMHGLMRRETALARLEAFDMNDRSSFQSLAARVPAAQRLSQQVETTLAAQRAAGVYNFSREQIFKYLLGEEMMNRATQGGERQRRQGAARVARQTVRPAGNRGDVATGSNRTRGGDDADRRLLESINLKDV